MSVCVCVCDGINHVQNLLVSCCCLCVCVCVCVRERERERARGSAGEWKKREGDQPSQTVTTHVTLPAKEPYIYYKRAPYIPSIHSAQTTYPPPNRICTWKGIYASCPQRALHMLYKRALFIPQRPAEYCPQKSHTYSAKEPYIYCAKGPYSFRREQLSQTKSVHIAHKRAIDFLQKSPIHSAKEPYTAKKFYIFHRDQPSRTVFAHVAWPA